MRTDKAKEVIVNVYATGMYQRAIHKNCYVEYLTSTTLVYDSNFVLLASYPPHFTHIVFSY